MFSVAIFGTLLALSNGCQEIRVKAEDGGVVVGRSLEFSIPLDHHLITEPAGTEHTSPKLPNCPGNPFTFSNRFKTIKYTAIFRGAWANSTGDGINEAGLSASVLYFSGNAQYADPSDITGTACDNAIPQTMVATYILASYETVEQVKNDLESGTFPAVWAGYDIGIVIPLHYNIIDRTGAGLVLEHVNEGVKWYDNTVGVITNSPPYPWHLDNLRNYPHFQRDDQGREGFKYSSLGNTYTLSPQWTGSGLLGLPGDYTSPSRFVKAATLLALAPTPATTNEAIVQVFHHMNAADIPFGIVEAGPLKRIGFNWWTLVKDLSGGCVFYRSYTDLSVKRLCLSDIPDVKSAIRMEGRFEDGFRDTAGELKDFDTIVTGKLQTEL